MKKQNNTRNMRHKLNCIYYNPSAVSPVSLFSRPLSSFSFFLIFILLLNMALFVNLADATILEPDFFSIGYACKDNLCIQNNSIKWLINITNQGKPLSIAEIKLKKYMDKSIFFQENTSLILGKEETKKLQFNRTVPALNKNGAFIYNVCLTLEYKVQDYRDALEQLSKNADEIRKGYQFLCFENNFTFSGIECLSDDYCNDREYCKNDFCMQARCDECEFNYNHSCRRYPCCKADECSINADCINYQCRALNCPSDEQAVNHSCIKLQCKDNEYAFNNTCNKLECDEDESAYNHSCIKLECKNNEYLANNSCNLLSCNSTQFIFEHECHPLICKEDYGFYNHSCMKLECNFYEKIEDHACAVDYLFLKTLFKEILTMLLILILVILIIRRYVKLRGNN